MFICTSEHVYKGSIDRILWIYSYILHYYTNYLTNYVLYTSDVSCRDTWSTNCNKLYTPNQTANLSASHSWILVLSSGMFSLYMLTMQLRLILLNLYIWNGNAYTAIEILVLLLPIWFCISYWFSQWFCIYYWFIQNICILHVFSMICMIWYRCPCKCIIVFYELQKR